MSAPQLSFHCAGAAALAAVLGVSACATTQRPVGAPHSMHRLAVCPGMTVANAPPFSPDGRLIDYSPITVVRGIMLARAPVDACLSSGFGKRAGGAGPTHEGIDLYTGAPRPVLAGGDGRVVSIADMRGYGLTVVIDHGRGVRTLYAHLSSFAPELRAGLSVRAGEPIARTGKSGNASAVHLHYEVLIDGGQVDPLEAGD
jgi:murein DD-endopeptidase MepM/ murein hydrolase activator NlpD